MGFNVNAVTERKESLAEVIRVQPNLILLAVKDHGPADLAIVRRLRKLTQAQLIVLERGKTSKGPGSALVDAGANGFRLRDY